MRTWESSAGRVTSLLSIQLSRLSFQDGAEIAELLQSGFKLGKGSAMNLTAMIRE